MTRNRNHKDQARQLQRETGAANCACGSRRTPRATALQAVRDLAYSHPDHMYVVADSIRIDLVRRDGVTP